MTAFAAELRILSNLSSTFLTGPSETHSFHLLNFRTESLLEDDYVGHVRRYAVSEQGFCVDAGRHRSRPRLKDQCRGSGSIFLSAVLSIAHMEQHKRKMTFGDLILERTVSRIQKEGVLPHVHPRALARTGTKGTKGSGLDERTGVGEGGQKGRTAL